HPIAESHRLFRLHGGIAQHALLALAYKAFESVSLDVFLGLEAKLLFDFDLDPQALTVKAILIAQFAPAHRPKAIEQILVGATPTVVHAHRIIRRDGPINERPARLTLVQGALYFECARLAP